MGPVPRDLRVCFVGDSFTAGVGDPDHLGWTGRLAAATERDGLPLTRYVLGVRRQTSAEVAARWAAECVPRLTGEWESRVVLSTGVNDTTHEDGVPRLDPARSVAALGAVLRGAADAGWPVLVVGPAAVADHAHNARTRALDDRFTQVCAGAGVPYVPVVRALAAHPTYLKEVASGDGAHPGAAGYTLLAELVRPQWTSWLAPLR